ncbi:ABC-2 type transport system ATP-binding protein [Salibacterium salarium]|uniref:ATP-binding cassette domain-containing protein n=1 Tax=Salibacterium salarium TaxID=284579 RepID=UPI002787FD31|nr:ATP-binding cassette domain-containing protein [Salibacterium salarium]MDQ0299901.1 ABC-2 type transport system ATP-binding protein [Salibacterium salarium]
MSEAVNVHDVDLMLSGQKVLEDIQLTVNHGEVIGIVGRNGSGKSVLFKAIAGFYQPSRGTIEVNGIDLYQKKNFPENFGCLIENPGFLPRDSGYKNLKLLADIQKKIGKKEIMQTLSLVGLEGAENKPVKRYSLGMKQRLGIAQAIMENPSVIVLDEPTNGLDKQGVKDVLEIILKLKEEGAAILISSHIQEDIDEVSDDVFEMDGGHISHVEDRVGHPNT